MNVEPRPRSQWPRLARSTSRVFLSGSSKQGHATSFLSVSRSLLSGATRLALGSIRADPAARRALEPFGPFGVRPSCFSGFPPRGRPFRKCEGAHPQGAPAVPALGERAESNSAPQQKETEKWIRK